MRNVRLLIYILSVSLIFTNCDDAGDPSLGSVCEDLNADLDYTIDLIEDYTNSENTFHIAAFHNVPDSDTTYKTNAIQITWEISPSVQNGISLLVKDDIWEIGEYSYSTVEPSNSFIFINTISSYGSTMSGISFSIKITEIEKGDLRDLGDKMQQDYTYLKGSFTGQFKNAALDEFPISGSFEICND